MNLIDYLSRALWPRAYGEAGNAMIEFALAVPILLILVLVTADYASLANDTLNLRAATRAAAQYARAHPAECSSCTTGAVLYGNFPAGATVGISVTCTCTNSNTDVGTTLAACGSSVCSAVTADPRVIQYINVSATQNFTPWVSYAGFAFPATLSASTSLRIQ